MRRWNCWCSAAAAGFSRRFLSPSPSPSPASLRPVPSIPTASVHPALWLPPTFRPLFPPLSMAMQVRHYAKKERSRAPLTPTTSKVKKYKLKAPSSMKFRFRTMRDGQIRRWRAGKRHNAHLKSKEAKRRLRKPALVHLAYAKVIKKLNFCG